MTWATKVSVEDLEAFIAGHVRAASSFFQNLLCPGVYLLVTQQVIIAVLPPVHFGMIH